MIQKPLPKFKKGDPIRAADIQALRDAIQRQRVLPGSSNAIIPEETANGTVLAFQPPFDRSLAKTSSTITARSGATPGAGTVVLQALDASGDIESTGVTYDVFSYSSTTGGIPTDTYCWIEKDMAGNWWIISVDCGN